MYYKGRTSVALAEAAEYFTSSLTAADAGTATFAHSSAKTEYKTDALAGAGITARVGTFNIKTGSNVAYKMEKLAELITPLELDIVGLQEVDVGTTRAGGIDSLKLLAEAADYPYYEFSAAIDYRGGKYGHGIMSMYPIKSYETVKLTTPDGMEQRVYGHAVIEINGQCIDYYNTHLSYESTDVRLVQFSELSAEVSDKRGYIVTADFNTPDIAERKLIEGGVLVNNNSFVTFPSKKTCIDDIVLHSGWDILDAGVVDSAGKSDHHLLWAEIHFSG